MQAINPKNTHAIFGKDKINTFPSNERKPSARTTDDRKSKNNMSTPHWGGHNSESQRPVVKYSQNNQTCREEPAASQE